MTDLLAAMAGQGLSGLDVTTLYPQASSPQATIIPGKLLNPVFFSYRLSHGCKQGVTTGMNFFSISPVLIFR